MDNANNSGLLDAVKGGNATGIKTFLSLGADPNAEDYRGMTALMHAAYRGYAEIVQILLDNNADPHQEHAAGEPVRIMTLRDPKKHIVSFGQRSPTALDYAERGKNEPPDDVKEKIVDYEKTIELLKR